MFLNMDFISSSEVTIAELQVFKDFHNKKLYLQTIAFCFQTVLFSMFKYIIHVINAKTKDECSPSHLITLFIFCHAKNDFYEKSSR